MRTIVGGSSQNNYPNLTGYVPEIFDIAGTYTYSVPSNCSKVYAMVWGAGGSGGFNSTQIATGGGGGGFAAGYISVTPSSSVDITIGSGGQSPSSSGAGNAGGNTTFGSFLTGGGGQGGAYSTTFQDTSGGSGGAGTVDDTSSVNSYITASGGRGGNWIHDTAIGGRCNTGGGNSGSLLGDGGNGGDCMSGEGSDFMISGGGGWGQGHAATLVKGSTGGICGGGGAPLNPAGVQHSYTSSQSLGRGQGMLFKGSNNYASTNSGTDFTTGFASSSRTDPSGAGTSWWNVLTGASFGGTAPMTINGVPIGHGGTGGIQGAISGGMCGGNGGSTSISQLTYWGGYWIAGGGGNTVNSNLGNLLRSNSALARKHLSCGNGAGSGAANTAYGLNGGHGICFVFPIIN